MVIIIMSHRALQEIMGKLTSKTIYLGIRDIALNTLTLVRRILTF